MEVDENIKSDNRRANFQLLQHKRVKMLRLRQTISLNRKRHLRQMKRRLEMRKVIKVAFHRLQNNCNAGLHHSDNIQWYRYRWSNNSIDSSDKKCLLILGLVDGTGPVSQSGLFTNNRWPGNGTGPTSNPQGESTAFLFVYQAGPGRRDRPGKSSQEVHSLPLEIVNNILFIVNIRHYHCPPHPRPPATPRVSAHIGPLLDSIATYFRANTASLRPLASTRKRTTSVLIYLPTAIHPSKLLHPLGNLNYF
ncbi:hypothetical protein RRG08_060082 [Elysia crispata]|uniref:Uncharacterized protein n=1 Tax=Elysia crispata TaxID=231223 RepID=A0AAE1CQV3_9GAST|nr:hypothetical protein RRG08_060082 [Elysia crispata]